MSRRKEVDGECCRILSPELAENKKRIVSDSRKSGMCITNE